MRFFPYTQLEPKQEIPWPGEPASTSFINRFACLLESNEVQSINFELGHVKIKPFSFSVVANALRSCILEVRIAPDFLRERRAAGGYEYNANGFILSSETVLNSEKGRGTLIHEAAHAGLDHAAQQTSVYHEEGAAFIASSWYYQEIGSTLGAVNLSGMDQPFNVIADGLRARKGAGGDPVRATSAEINATWSAIRDIGHHKLGFYNNNGF